MAVLTAENLSARVGDGLKLSRNNGTQSQRIIDAFRTLFPESSPKLSLAAGSYTWDDGYVSPKPFPKSTPAVGWTDMLWESLFTPDVCL